MKTHTTSGIQVTEYDEPDTEDIELTAPDPLADQWERFAQVYAEGTRCSSCMWSQSGPLGIECDAMAPDQCPGLNPRSIAAGLRRQAS